MGGSLENDVIEIEPHGFTNQIIESAAIKNKSFRSIFLLRCASVQQEKCKHSNLNFGQAPR